MQLFIATGNLGGDPEFNTTKNDTSVCNFSIAVRSGFGEYERTDWFRCVAWGKLAETCEKFCRKGDKIQVVGEVHFDKYDDKEGNEKTSTQVVLKSVEFISVSGGGEEPKRSSAKSSSSKGSGGSRKRDAVREARQAEDDFSDDDVPF